MFLSRAIFISKLVVKMNLRIITKNHAADPKIRLLRKSISKPYGRVTAIPTAWELRQKFSKGSTNQFKTCF